jgi:hypothetical protein
MARESASTTETLRGIGQSGHRQMSSADLWRRPKGTLDAEMGAKSRKHNGRGSYVLGSSLQRQSAEDRADYERDPYAERNAR